MLTIKIYKKIYTTYKSFVV